jgi:Tol biopolymer transport system component
MVAFIAALALGFAAWRNSAAETPRVMKASLLYDEGSVPSSNAVPAISPDGTRVAFVASSEGDADAGQIWIRDLNSLTARPLAGTNGARYPFWSPDGKFIGFFAERKLKRIDAQGAPPITLADARASLGGSWSVDDVILYRADETGLRRISAKGGDSVAVTHRDVSQNNTIDGSDDLPWFLPDGHHFFYTSKDRNDVSATIYVADIGAPDLMKSRRKVVSAVSNAVYSDGYVLFVLERTLMAQRFDLDKLEVSGDPIPVAEQINYRAGGADMAFSASQNGTLIYSAGASATEVQLTWFDRAGKPLGTLGTLASQLWPGISPDETRVVIDRRDRPRTGLFELWLFDLKKNDFSRFTLNSDMFVNNFPVWSPDGKYIAYASNRDGQRSIFRKPSEGGADEALDRDALWRLPTDWSRDGNFIIEAVTETKTRDDIWILPMNGDRKSYPYIRTEANERSAKLSPNGLWMAYASDESKTPEILCPVLSHAWHHPQSFYRWRYAPDLEPRWQGTLLLQSEQPHTDGGLRQQWSEF